MTKKNLEGENAPSPKLLKALLERTDIEHKTFKMMYDSHSRENIESVKRVLKQCIIAKGAQRMLIDALFKALNFLSCELQTKNTRLTPAKTETKQ